MYGISDASQMSSLFGTAAPSYTSAAAKLPIVSTGTALYGVNTAKPTGQEHALLNLKRDASSLRESLSALMEDLQSGSTQHAKMLVVSADEDVASAALIQDAVKMSGKDISLSVSRLAGQQTSQTNSMRSGELNFEMGKHTIAIESANGGSAKVSIEVGQDDNNEAVLRKLADAVNERGLSINAEVEVDRNSGTVSLSFVSSDTGTRNAFEIKDSRGTLVDTSGLSVQTAAADAEYKVDGARRISSYNDIEIGGRVSVRLKDIGESRLSFTRDVSGVAKSVGSFVTAYNDLLDSNEKVAGQLNNASEAYRKPLTDSGIAFDEEGRLSVKEDLLEESLTGGALKSLFNGGSYGFSSRIDQITRHVERAPQIFAAEANTYSSYNAERLNTQQNQVSFMLGLFYNSFI